MNESILDYMLPFLEGKDSLNNCLDKVVEKMNELCEKEIRERMKDE